ncbi:hypothetical protein ACFRU3_40745 [Streptomyces sp. NPDC056910]|uniref:hypothetical protein n=1 Tax=Streptomyces sp. NPDC056910 TaxID=3345964 RepID=UPI00369CC8CD
MTGPNSGMTMAGSRAASLSRVSAQRTVSRRVRIGVPMLGMPLITTALAYRIRSPGSHTAVTSPVSDSDHSSPTERPEPPRVSESVQVWSGNVSGGAVGKSPTGLRNWRAFK